MFCFFFPNKIIGFEQLEALITDAAFLSEPLPFQRFLPGLYLASSPPFCFFVASLRTNR